MRMWRSIIAAGVIAIAGVPVEAQQFGAYAVAGDGEILISEPVKPNEPATVYVYRNDSGSWEQVATLTAPPHDGGDYFGRFLAMDS